MLPIDVQLPEIVETLRRERRLLLQAPPGAGKTTRLPPALLDACEGEIVVLEPRRLAARLAATHVAHELGGALGDAVGFTVRYENRSGPNTRIRFVTEGVLTRRLLSDPELRGVSVVLLDEFHERHVQGDLALALLLRLQQTTRPDLWIAALSATLDTAPVAQYMHNAPIIQTDGRAHPVHIEHTEGHDDRPLELRVVSALRTLLRDGLRGHTLVFLPGAAEIRRAMDAAQKIATEYDLALFPLHGELPPEEQDRALGRSERRKVLFSTNVAESSVTLDGVEAVIDAGLSRSAKFDPWMMLSELSVGKCSRASAVQRAGRAGRQGPGRAIRLYSASDFAARPEFDEPEMLRTDPAQVVLELAAARALDVELLSPPPAASMQGARQTLEALQLLEPDGALSELGRRAAQLPLSPRLAKLVLEGAARQVGQRSCLLAALLSERDPRRRALFGEGHAARAHEGPVEDSDLDALADRIEEVGSARGASAARAAGLEPLAVQRIERARRALATQLRLPREDQGHPDEQRSALTLAFFDRVAKRRSKGSRDLALVSGHVAELSERSAVRDAPLLLCLQGEKKKKPLVTSACRIEPELLLELLPERIHDRVRSRFDAASGKVITRSELLYDGLVLDDAPAEHGEEAAQLLLDAAWSRGLHTLLDGDALESLRARLELGAARGLPLTPLDDDALKALLREGALGCSRLEELREVDWMGLLRARIEHYAQLERHLPERLQLPNGRSARIHYARGQQPWVESFLQDFCGLRGSPEVAGQTLVLHLLAPNRRAVQITQDLPNFWRVHYPELKRALSRKYPRHSWPDDPSVPVPAHVPRRG